ncbi:DUF4236 domain-containing protein [Clostridium cuniculi]|uniref:DUF4236 domain-containing protein n=1 Tax=Clostridium cuniculi TaxID=2548455 RepID=UPI001054499A|nr:DUF4236 domain-containing protein [Clostridium cuniculi]
MGFRFRKSINLGGGFRINLSKSGIGYSFGVPGYRVTKTAKGKTRKTYSIPGTGISYIQESKKVQKNKTYNNSNNLNNQYIYNVENSMQEITNAQIEQLQSAEHKDLIHKIENISSLDAISNILLFLIIFSTIPGLIICPIVGLILKILILTKWRVNLDYSFEDDTYKEFENKVNAWFNLNQSEKKWQVTHEATVINKKISAGASTNIKRAPLKILKKTPYFIKSNINPILLELKKEKLFIFPDKILIFNNNKIGAISYNDIQINIQPTSFIENQSVPKDSKILSYTWQYVNKNGGPDKRYKNNRQLPICQYGYIKIKSNDALNVELLLSNLSVVNEFYSLQNINNY